MKKKAGWDECNYKDYVLSPKEHDYLKEALGSLIKRQKYYPKKPHGWRDGDAAYFFDRRVEHQFDKFQINGHQHEGGFNAQQALGTALSSLVYPVWWPEASKEGYASQNAINDDSNKITKKVNEVAYTNLYQNEVPSKIKHYHLDDGQFKDALYNMGRMQNDGKYYNVDKSDLKNMDQDYYPKKFKSDLQNRSRSVSKKPEKVYNTPRMPIAGLSTDKLKDQRRSDDPESKEPFEKYVLDHRMKMNDQNPKQSKNKTSGQYKNKTSGQYNANTKTPNKYNELEPYSYKPKK